MMGSLLQEFYVCPAPPPTHLNVITGLRLNSSRPGHSTRHNLLGENHLEVAVRTANKFSCRALAGLLHQHGKPSADPGEEDNH